MSDSPQQHRIHIEDCWARQTVGRNPIRQLLIPGGRFGLILDDAGRWTAEDRERAVELYEGGLNLDEVARALGRPYSSTRYSVARSGCSRSPSETRAARLRAA